MYSLFYCSISYMEFLRSFLEDQVNDPSDKTLYRSKLQPTRILVR